jgi:hypothetical protein
MRLLIFLLSASVCFGQLTMQQMQPFFNGSQSAPQTPCQIALGTGFPTNITGYPAYGWWVSGCYSTNAGVATLHDYSELGLDLTMVAAGLSPIGGSGSWNGFKDVLFGTPNVNTLTNKTATIWIPAGNLAEFWCVMAFTNVAGQLWLFHDVSATGTGLAAENDRFSGAKMSLVNNANATEVFAGGTNKYMVFNFVYTSGANATIYTNNVQGVNVNIGGNDTMTSFRLGGGPSGNNPLIFSFLEGGWFRTNLTAAGRLALYQYCTNKYALPP